MADVVQTETFRARTFPFKQNVPFDAPAYPGVIMPWGQAIVDQTFESDAIGAGDTGTLVMDIGLPADFCCMLRSLHISSKGLATNNWISGVIGLAYQMPGGPYKHNQVMLPEVDYLWWPLFSHTPGNRVRDRNSNADWLRIWTISAQAAGPVTMSANLDNPADVPLWVPPTADTDFGNRTAIIYIENDTASSPVNDFRLNLVFDIYTQEQAYASTVMSSPRVLAT